ncbi:hypothetical protein M9458_052233 [Cirrhinus mrigala]|uniref:Uncharacterized protein n=1 Tax=Cirrhinus mrigala TaxID=683832 RepID=A0ABD0MR38_CIRMR
MFIFSRADLKRLKDEFIKLYESDHPQLQQCMKNVCQILQTFEKDYRVSTEGSRIAGRIGRAGGAAMVAGLAAAPFTMGLSVFLAPVVVGVVGGTVMLHLQLSEKGPDDTITKRH